MRYELHDNTGNCQKHWSVQSAVKVTTIVSLSDLVTLLHEGIVLGFLNFASGPNGSFQ